MIINVLVESIIQKKSPIVVGLDPRLESIPSQIKEPIFEKYGETLEAVGHIFLAFNQGIIDAIAEDVPAVKPQIAFYEQYGIEGLKAYASTCDYAKEKGLIVVADAKRGDIGSTSQAYADAFIGETAIGNQTFEAFKSDFVTVNPYLGDDCLKPFVDNMKDYDKGMFVLVKTSNPSSGQIQDLYIDGEKLYIKTAEIVENWAKEYKGNHGYSPVGAVVGATYPEELSILREKMPSTFFLVPGYGAQGGKAEDIVHAFDHNGLGAIVNSSRAIIFAHEKSDQDYIEAAKAAVKQMKNDINDALEGANKKYW